MLVPRTVIVFRLPILHQFFVANKKKWWKPPHERNPRRCRPPNQRFTWWRRWTFFFSAEKNIETLGKKRKKWPKISWRDVIWVVATQICFTFFEDKILVWYYCVFLFAFCQGMVFLTYQSESIFLFLNLGGRKVEAQYFGSFFWSFTTDSKKKVLRLEITGTSFFGIRKLFFFRNENVTWEELPPKNMPWKCQVG